jgi:hypothetical protein
MSEQLSAGRELDVAVHAALGNYGFRYVSDDEFAQNIPQYSATPYGCELMKKWLRSQQCTVTVVAHPRGEIVCKASGHSKVCVIRIGDTEAEAIAQLVLAVKAK